MTDRRVIASVCGLLALIGAFVYVRHIADGGFYSDDWATLSAATYAPYSTLVDVYGHLLGSRPLLAWLIPLPFEVFGSDVEWHHAVAALLGLVTCGCFYAVLRATGLESGHALPIATLAFLFPWSDSVRFWPTASLNQLAVSAYLLGLVVALWGLRTVGARSIALHGVSCALYVLSVLTYEVAGIAALASIVLYRLAAPWRSALRRAAFDLVILLPVLWWVGEQSVKPVASFGEQVSAGATIARDAVSLTTRAAVPVDGVPKPLIGVALVVLLAFATRVARDRTDPRAAAVRRWLGVSALAFGAVFVSYALFVPSTVWRPLARGLDNRVNILAAFPMTTLVFALVLIGCLLLQPRLRGRLSPTALAVAITGLIGLGYAVQLDQDRADWKEAAVEQGRILSAIDRHHPRRGTTVYTFGHRAQTAPRLPVFYETWDLNGAVQAELGDPTLRAYPAYGDAAFRCGPDGVVPERLPTPFGARLDGPGLDNDPERPYLGPDDGSPYGRTLFVDVRTGQGRVIADARTCRQAVRSFRPGPFD